MPTKKTAWPLIAAALLLLQPAGALAPPPPGKNAGTSVHPIPIRVGETLSQELPAFGPPMEVDWRQIRSAGYALPHSLLFEVVAEEDGPLTIEARSLDMDMGLRVSSVNDEGEPEPIAADKNSGLNLDSLVVVEAQQGTRYRVEAFQLTYLDELPGEFELSVRAGRFEIPEDVMEGSGIHLSHARTLEARAAESGRREMQMKALYRQMYVTGLGLGDTAAAIPPGERALEIAESILPADHEFLNEICWYLGANTMWVGDFERARALAERALEISRARGPGAALNVALNLGLLSELQYLMGDFSESRASRLESIEIREEIQPTGHGMGLDQARLAELERAMGFPGEAVEHLERALAIATRIFDESPDWYTAGYLEEYYLDHSGLLRELGDLETADADLRKAWELFESHISGKTPNDYSQFVWYAQERARFELARGSPSKALGHLERAAATYVEKLGPDHPYVADLLELLARLRSASGDPARALEDANRALTIHEQALGRAHPRVGENLSAVAAILAALGRPAEAIDAALRSESISRNHVRRTSASLHQELALRYAASREPALDLALSLGSAGPSPETAAALWDAVVRSRAIVLDTMAARHLAVYRSDDPETAALAREYRRKSTQLANLLVRGLASEKQKPEQYREIVGAVRLEVQETETALASRSRQFETARAARDVGLRDVQAALPAGAALVGYVQYREQAPGDAARATRSESPARSAGADPAASRTLYAAFVKPPGNADPVLIPLDDAGVIDDKVRRWREAVAAAGGGNAAQTTTAGTATGGAANAAAVDAPGRILRQEVWDPLAQHLKDAERVFVVPDGALNLVNVAALPLDEGGYLLERGPAIHYLSAERDLVVGDDRGGSGRTLMALGGVDFDATGTFAALKPRDADAETDEPATPQAAAQVAALASFRGDPSTCETLKNLRFDHLEHTGAEIDEIAALWEKETAQVLAGAAATEGAFKAQAPGREHLHLATHGFFLGGECKAALAGSRGLGDRGFGGVATAHALSMAGGSDQPPPPVEGEDPLRLSGLVLAGANNREHAGPEEDDGILTAQEIAAMDLSSVEWAVLSACDTGVGEIRAGEGVFGLRRAFQVAGADTLIMSLWSVEDESARRWMKVLYEGRLAKGMDTAEAVRHASLTVLKDRRDRGLSDHPFYWAGFVAAGDWR